MHVLNYAIKTRPMVQKLWSGASTDSDVLGGCVYFDTAIPTSSKEATIFVVNFVVTWKVGLNDLTLHIDLIFYSGLRDRYLLVL